MTFEPTQIVPPSLVVDLANALYQYAVTLSGPTKGRGPTGEETVTFAPVHQHVPAMIAKAALGGGVEQRVMGDVTVEQALHSISLGGLFTDVTNEWQVTDEATGQQYDVVGVDHPVNLMTVLSGLARSPEVEE